MQRRTFIQRSATWAALSFAGLREPLASPKADEPRLLVVLLRGGMDGLTAAPPVADPLYESMRANIAVKNALPLDGSFALHPQLKVMHSLWAAGHLAVVHSTGFGYTGRSHFEGQDIMQTGMAKPYTSASGWIGRAMQASGQSGGVSISIPMPLILRGNPAATTQFPNWMPPLSANVADALPALWADDPMLAAYAPVIRAENLALRQGAMNNPSFQNARAVPQLARLAAKEMREPNGPRVGLIDMQHGFDTHASQGADSGTHADRLGELDALVGAYKEGMGDAWANALVVTVTEFGRTAAENGTTGTDHGVGSCCFLAGGLLTGSRVYADWRGLKKEQLFEGRDLPASIDLAAVYARVMERVFGLSPKAIQDQVMAHRPSPALKGLLGLG